MRKKKLPQIILAFLLTLRQSSHTARELKLFYHHSQGNVTRRHVYVSLIKVTMSEQKSIDIAQNFECMLALNKHSEKVAFSLQAIPYSSFNSLNQFRACFTTKSIFNILEISHWGALFCMHILSTFFLSCLLELVSCTATQLEIQ